MREKRSEEEEEEKGRDRETGKDNSLSNELKSELKMSEKGTLCTNKIPKSEENKGQSDMILPEEESAVIVEGVVGEREPKDPVLSEEYLSPSFTVSATSGPFGL